MSDCLQNFPDFMMALKNGISNVVSALLGNGAGIKELTIRQAVSGGIATLSDLCMFQILLMISPLPVMWASLVSTCLNTLFNFFLSKLYVFHDYKFGVHALRQLSSYALVAVTSIGLIQLCVWIFAVVLGIWPLLAKCMAVPIVFFWGLLLSKKFIFRQSKRQSSLLISTNDAGKRHETMSEDHL